MRHDGPIELRFGPLIDGGLYYVINSKRNFCRQYSIFISAHNRFDGRFFRPQKGQLQMMICEMGGPTIEYRIFDIKKFILHAFAIKLISGFVVF